MAEDDPEPGRRRALHHGSSPQEPALLHHLELDQVGRLAPDDLHERGGVGHALVRHERDADAAPDPGEAGEVVTRDRLLDQHQGMGLEAGNERDRLIDGEALVEVHAERHACADRGADGGDPLDPLVGRARDLDLGRPKAALAPRAGFAGRLLRRDRPDPGVERDGVLHPAPEERVDRQAERTGFEVDERHLDGGLRLRGLGHRAVHAGEGGVQVEGIGADEGRRHRPY